MNPKIQHIIVVTDQGVKVYPGEALSAMASTIVRDISNVKDNPPGRTYGHSDAKWILEEMLTKGIA